MKSFFRTYFQKYIPFVAIFGICFFLAKDVNAQQTDFAGNWLINLNKSTIGDVPIKAPKKVTIELNKSSVTITRIGNTMDEDTTLSTETLSLDGQKLNRDLPGGYKKIASITYSADNNEFIEDADYSGVTEDGEEQKYSMKTTFTIINKSTLKVKYIVTTNSEQGPVKYGVIGVYDKQ
jgi:hypothetical protein